MLVVASTTLQNLADRLAHQFSGVSLNSPVSTMDADRLVVITDGQDIPGLRGRLDGVTARRRTLISVGLEPKMARLAFEDFEVISVGEIPDSRLWSAVVSALDAAPTPVAMSPIPAVFLSHAVADEERLVGAVHALRRDFGVTVFSCSDSIRSGSQWQDEIQRYLADCDVFVFVASKSANLSVFCAFEAGYAVASGKPVRVIDLDGVGPPSHLSQLHAADVPRLRAVQPWLNTKEILLDTFLSIL